MVVLSTAEQSLLLPKPAVSNDGSASARQHDSTTHAPETSHPAANGQQMTLKALIVATGGTVLEFFDFAVFGYFASVISEEFFPAGNKSAALAETFAVFAGAFCMRPLGGIIFGYLGDRFGHEKALLGSIVMMAVSTFLMGCLPTYRQVGAWAPTFLILVRSLQGLSCGGQLVGGFLVAIENTPAEQSGFFGSVVFASTVVGTAGGSGVAALMRAHMTPAALHSWGWRVPFWCGIFIGLFGYLARGSEMHVSKSADSPSKHKSDKPPKNPLLVAVSESWYDILVIAAACSYTTCSFYLIMVWIVTYLTSMHESNPAQHSAFTINTISMLGVISLFLPFGHLSDKIGQEKQMLCALVFCILTIFPAYDQLGRGTLFSASCGQALLLLPFAAYSSALPAWIVRRARGPSSYMILGLAWNLATAVFGGTAPLIATTLSKPELAIPISMFPRMPTPVASYHLALTVGVLVVMLADRHWNPKSV